MKSLSVKFAFAVSACVMFSVGYFSCSGSSSCDASSCPTGCCDSTNTCQVPSTSDCGINGATCTMCTTGQQCKAGSCVGASGNGGGTAATGGGTAATGGGTAATGGGTAATGGGTAATGGGTAATGGGTAATGGGTAATGGGTAGTGGGTPDAGCTGTVLTVIDAPTGTPWCNVSVNGSTPSNTATQTFCVQAGAVTVAATALNSGFQLGDWHHTDGDTGTGDPGTVADSKSTAMVTVGANAKCIWVCCPFTGGTGCPTTEQCP